MKIDIDSKNLTLRKNATLDHESAEDWYGSYGAHTSTEQHGDITADCIDFGDLGKTDEEIAEILRESFDLLTDAEIESMIALSRRIKEAAEGVIGELEKAVEAYEEDDLEGVIEHLQAARSQETDHGDDPATSGLAAHLLEEGEISEEQFP